MKKQFQLRVGIMSEPVVRFRLDGKYVFNGEEYTGEQQVSARLGHVCWHDKMYPEINLLSTSEDCRITLHDVTIGVGFHWERHEDQVFTGGLRLIAEQTTITGLPSAHENITAINLVGLENYLTSVISSEMSATSSMELLKAHAVTSRSWVLCPIQRNRPNHEKVHGVQTAAKRIVWYERDSHNNFDVCADDHCQRYQGITRVSAAAENVRKAIEATWGEVLTAEVKRTDGIHKEICDARFYKCCGGRTELFENAWADEHYKYLESVEDSAEPGGHSFCNTDDKRILSQVLNGYDQETADFYTWQVHYTKDELSTIVKERSGIDFGEVTNLVPVRRGPSYRIVELDLVGTKRTMRIGKELEIRRILSRSHLYSSAFDVEKTADGFTLHGRGWGHGVGLCQIGAAVMAEKGYDYKQIVQHYFPGAQLEQYSL